MIARLFVLTPFVLSVPEGTQFTLFDQNVDGYTVRFLPPKRNASSITGDEALNVTINGKPAQGADTIHIDFCKAVFDRSLEALCDPPYDLIKRILDFYILRLRHVTRAAIICPISFPNTNWRLQYLNDDESELEPQDGHLRARWARWRQISCIALTDGIWNEIHSLPSDYAPPPWESLLFDASIPGTPTGNAIVLAATALEVFISHILDRLAKTKAQPQQLWSWINNRSDHQREPSVEEQFDTLLHILCGHSLKEDPKLWESFKNLKSARNSFVHEGVVKIGKNSTPVGSDVVLPLISSASLIIAKIREWLPPELHWKLPNHNTSIEMIHQVFP